MEVVAGAWQLSSHPFPWEKQVLAGLLGKPLPTGVGWFAQLKEKEERGMLESLPNISAAQRLAMSNQNLILRFTITSLYAFPEYLNIYVDFFNLYDFCIKLRQMYFKAFKAIS